MSIPRIIHLINFPRNCSGANNNKRDLAIKFLFECSDKLSIKPLTVAAAALFYHRFYTEVDKCEYDEFVSVSHAVLLDIPALSLYSFPCSLFTS